MAERTVNNYRIRCQTESNYVYTWSQTIPTTCPNNNTHTIDPVATTIVDTVSSGNYTITGKDVNGTYYNTGVSYDNKLSVDVPFSAFGNLKVTSEYPQVIVDFRYGLSTRFTTSTLSNLGTVTSSNCFAYVASGAAENSYALLNSNRFLRYVPGQGANMMFTGIYATPKAGNVQILGGGTTTNGFFFGYNGTAFGILTRNRGVDTWILQTTWNIDKMDGTGPSGQVLNPQKGNVYRITFQWLGFGAQTFMIEETTTGKFYPVHKVAYANTQTILSLANPCLPLYAQSLNTTNTTSVVLQSSCFAGMSEGIPMKLGAIFGEDNLKTLSNTTLTNIISIKSKTTINNLNNLIFVTLYSLSYSATGNANGTIYIYLNPTVAGTPVWTDINTTDSSIQLDTAGTIVSGGSQLAAYTFIVSQVQNLNLTDLDICILPGNTLVIAAKLIKAGSTDVSASITWSEER